MRKARFRIQTYYHSEKNLYIKKANRKSIHHLERLGKIHKLVFTWLEKKNNATILMPKIVDTYTYGFEIATGYDLLSLIKNKEISLEEALKNNMNLIDELPQYMSHQDLNTTKLTAQVLYGDGPKSGNAKSDLVIGVMDLTPSNIFRDQEHNKTTLIDQERFVESPLPRSYLKFRVIYDVYNRLQLKNKHLFNQLLHKQGISASEITLYAYWEKNFQSYVYIENLLISGLSQLYNYCLKK